MKTTILNTCKKQIFHSLKMLNGFITACPGELWHEKQGGFIFWQQLFHCLEGTHYWLLPEGESYQPPFAGKRVFPGLEKDAVDQLSRKELEEYLQSVMRQAERYFKNLTEEKLTEASFVDKKKSRFEVILIQLRHIQYHAGHCNSIFREQGLPAVEWIE